MKPSLILLTTTALTLSSAALRAQEAVTDNSAADNAIVLETVVLSGGLSPIPADAYTRAHTVLTGAEIDQRGIATVQDALRAVPGVSISGAGPSMTQIRLRGAEGNHALVLIDGIEAAGGADEYMLSGLETADIDRIEVLRGPQSVFYGSNASAGVINIVTRSGAKGQHYGGAVEAGNGAAASAYVTGRDDRGGVALTLGARNDRGWDISGKGGEKDGTNRRTLGLSGDYRLTDDLTVGASARWAREHYDYDAIAEYDFAGGGVVDGDGKLVTGPEGYVIDTPGLSGKRREFQGGVWAAYTMLDGRLTHRLDYQDTISKQAYDGRSFTRGETQKLKYRLSYGLDGQPVDSTRHLLNVLAERQRDRSSAAPDGARDMTAVALEYRGFLDNGLDIQAGIRHDDNRQFRDFTSWNLGLSWQLPDRPLRLHASAGSALVNPSFYELFADDAYTRGNPDLKPEINRGVDLGIEWQLPGDRGTLDVTWFRERMEDEITYVYGRVPDGRATYANDPGESPREGVEVTGRLQATPDLTLGLAYTYLDARNADGTIETRRPRHQFALSATQVFAGGKASVTADLRHVSGNFDSQGWGSYQVAELPAYTVVNLAGGYDLTPNLRLTGRIVNLFDTDHSDVWGYAEQGRTAYLGLRAGW